jgi:hypothetical protein
MVITKLVTHHPLRCVFPLFKIIWMQILARVPASAYLVHDGVVAIEAEFSFVEALRMLKEAGVSAAPVFANEVTGVRGDEHKGC